MKISFPNQHPTRNAAMLAFILSFLLNFYHLLVIFFHDRPMMEDRLRPHGVSVGIDYALNVIFIFLISFILYRLYEILLVWGQQNKSIKWIKIPALFFIAPLLAHIGYYAQTHLYDYPAFIQRGIQGSYLGRTVLIVFVVIGINEFFQLLKKQHDQGLEIERLAAENSRSQYQAIRNQVNPHFLFNSLNTLNALIPTDPALAQKYVEELATLFRHSLGQKEFCTLREELVVAQSYAYLMKMRYGDSLAFNFDISESAQDKHVVSFALQMLLENAVKHNTISHALPLSIHVYINDNGNLVVSNPMQMKRSPEHSEGIGLQNLVSRYRLLFRKEIYIRMIDHHFEVEIPLL